jgi:hypothetical protein
MSFIASIRNQRNKELEAQHLRPGYYLVKGDDRCYVSPDVSVSALERVCDRVLSDSKGWGYWINYCYGPDVTGKPAWSNIDHIDKFI